MNQRDKAIAFFRNPDSQSLAKSRFAAYYLERINNSIATSSRRSFFENYCFS